MSERWDNRFLAICSELSKWSSCKSRQIGAVIVRDKVIISTGYNGPPRGIPHCGDVCPRRVKGFKSGEGLHICPALHAEENAILNAARVGASVLDTTMYMSCGIPCKDCLKKIINVGIREIVCTSSILYDDLSRFLISESDLMIRYVN